MEHLNNLVSLVSLLISAVAVYAAFKRIKPETAQLVAEAEAKEAGAADILTNRAMLFLQQAEERFSREIAALEERLQAEKKKVDELEEEVQTLKRKNEQLEEKVRQQGLLLVAERQERMRLERLTQQNGETDKDDDKQD